MPSVPTASNHTDPFGGDLHDMFHQVVKVAASATESPSYFNPVPVATNLAGGTIGTAYAETISAEYGTSPYSFALASGSTLPAGLALSAAGVISGTPTAIGSTSFTVEVTDANGYSGSYTFQLTITAAATAAAPNYCVIN